MKQLSLSNPTCFSHVPIIMAMLIWLSGCSGIPSASLFSKASSDRYGNDGGAAMLSRKQQAEVCQQTGLNLAAHERDDHAIVQLLKARELNPQQSGIAYPLAVLYDRAGRFGPAEQEYGKALQETPANAELLNDFGYFRYCQGRFEEARQLLQTAGRLNPQHPKISLNLAMVAAAEENFDDAYALFAECVGPAAAHQNIGLLMLRAGRENEAIAHLQTASELDPSLQTAEIALAAANSNQDFSAEAAIVPVNATRGFGH